MLLCQGELYKNRLASLLSFWLGREVVDALLCENYGRVLLYSAYRSCWRNQLWSINVCAAASLNEIYIKLLGEITILYIKAPSRKRPIDLIDRAVLYIKLLPADCACAWAEKCVRHIMYYYRHRKCFAAVCTILYFSWQKGKEKSWRCIVYVKRTNEPKAFINMYSIHLTKFILGIPYGNCTNYIFAHCWAWFAVANCDV